MDAPTTVATKTHSERANLRTQPLSPRASLIAGSLLLLVCVHLGLTFNGNAQDTLSEYQVKAAYLFNFLKFVEWPAEAFADPLSPIVIGIAGEDPFGNALPQAVIGKTVQGRDLVIRKYRAGENLRASHILFICASEKKRLPELLASLHGSNVLTVADVEGFLEEGGMIRLFSEDRRVRFAINVDATMMAKLKVSSKLLSLARVAVGNGKKSGS